MVMDKLVRVCSQCLLDPLDGLSTAGDYRWDACCTTWLAPCKPLRATRRLDPAPVLLRRVVAALNERFVSCLDR